MFVDRIIQYRKGEKKETERQEYYTSTQELQVPAPTNLTSLIKKIIIRQINWKKIDNNAALRMI